MYISLYSSSSTHADNTDSFDYHTICLYRPSLLASLLECIQCPYKGDECKSLLLSQHCSVHELDSFMCSSLLQQQCRACLFWVVFEMGGRLP